MTDTRTFERHKHTLLRILAAGKFALMAHGQISARATTDGGWSSFRACFVFCIPHVRMIPLAVFTVEQRAAALEGCARRCPGVAFVLNEGHPKVQKPGQTSALYFR